MTTVISVENVTKSFSLRSKKRASLSNLVLGKFLVKKPTISTTVLSNVTFSVRAGEIVGLIGKNGTGKTTLLRLIADIYVPSQGTITTQGKVISLLDLRLSARDQLTVTDAIILLSALFDTQLNSAKTQLILDFAELQMYADAYLYQMSQGMVQRLVLGVALQAEPKILLLDEVLENSDYGFRQKAGRMLKRLAKAGTAIIITSHDRDIIGSMCQRVLILDQNQVIQQFPIRKLSSYLEYL